MVSSITLLSTHHLLLTNKGWKHKVELEDGIRTMFEWYLNNKKGKNELK